MLGKTHTFLPLIPPAGERDSDGFVVLLQKLLQDYVSLSLFFLLLQPIVFEHWL